MVFAQETFLGTGSARCVQIVRQGAGSSGGLGGGAAPGLQSPLLYSVVCKPTGSSSAFCLLGSWSLRHETRTGGSSRMPRCCRRAVFNASCSLQ